MYKILTIVFFSTWSLSLFGQKSTHYSWSSATHDNQELLQIFLNVDFENNTEGQIENYIQEYEKTLAQMDDLRQRMNDKAFLVRMFYRIQQKKLKWYEHYTTLVDLLSKGRYDCLTGTALYALLLNDLGYPFEIYEFDYHILLVVQSSEGPILFETTDPINGAVTDPQEIQARLNQPINELNNKPVESIKGVGALDKEQPELVNKIGLKELAGLQYLNLAVEKYRLGNVPAAIDLIEAAKVLYPSDRVQYLERTFQLTQMITRN